MPEAKLTLHLGKRLTKVYTDPGTKTKTIVVDPAVSLNVPTLKQNPFAILKERPRV